MKKFLLLATLCFFMSLSANEVIIDQAPRNIKTVFYGCHSYICFDDKFYIHDPDCRCDAYWVSITKDYQENVITTTKYIRLPVNNYD